MADRSGPDQQQSYGKAHARNARSRGGHPPNGDKLPAHLVENAGANGFPDETQTDCPGPKTTFLPGEPCARREPLCTGGGSAGISWSHGGGRGARTDSHLRSESITDCQGEYCLGARSNSNTTPGHSDPCA